MIPNWKERPTIVANLLNPAFCGEIIRIAIKSYTDEHNQPMPFPLLFLILPLVLQKQTREKLPATTSKKIYEWLEENTVIKIHLSKKVKNLVPYTREAILFLIYHEAIKINDNGKLEYIKYRKKSINYIQDEEIQNIYKKSQMIGKWFTRIGDTKTIYASIGIKP